MYQNIKYYAYLQSSISFMKKKFFGRLSINLVSVGIYVKNNYVLQLKRKDL